jgi:hypothetical protein
MAPLPSALGGSFVPTLQFEKLEIHKVCLRFPNFDLKQNLSPITRGNRAIGYFECFVDVSLRRRR